MHRTRCLVLLLACSFGACDEEEWLDDEVVEDLTIVVEADKSRIEQVEQSLRQRQRAVSSERVRLTQQRNQIAAQLSSLSKKDKKQRLKLEAEEKRVAEEQQSVRARMESFEKERQQLDSDKNELLERIARMTQDDGVAAGREIAQREKLIAVREKELADRETRLAERERDIATRETEVAQHLARLSNLIRELRTAAGTSGDGAPQGSVVSTAATASTQGGAAKATTRVTRGTAHKAARQVRYKMEKKGLLLVDLGADARDLDRDAKAAMSSKDYTGAHSAFQRLLTLVDETRVDRGLVQTKLARINALYQEKKNGGKIGQKQQKRIQQLLQDIGDSIDGSRIERANKKINQIQAMLGG